MTEQNWKNRTLFHGDNLEIMRGMNSNTVDLIATDPPFNKGRDFHANTGPESLVSGASFQDRWSWEDDVQQEWLDKIADDFPKVLNIITGVKSSYGNDMAAYLCFLGVRLLEMKRLLKPTGSIYLHCDHTASHYIKILMDAIFGKRNFRNEIVWCYTGPGNAKRDFPRKHDTILRYVIGDIWTFNGDSIRVSHAEGGIHMGGVSFGEGISEKNLEFYNVRGKLPESWWPEEKGNGFSPVGRLTRERTGYPTQKPLALYERIIKASSNSNEVVLDPFCGCATTLVAAERLERQWVGIDLWNKAHEVVVDRLKSIGLLGSNIDTIGHQKQGNFALNGDLIYSNESPIRTDDGVNAVPEIRSTKSTSIISEPPGPKMSRAQMLEELIKSDGLKCKGCDRVFDDVRYLQLDHNTPRSDGGINHISNRILLCGPCNQEKSNDKTLPGLRNYNKKNGYMVKS